VKLSVALTVKATTTRRALTYVCSPREASWECIAESVPDAASSCDGDTIHLARGRGDDILLINRKEGLPIDATCQAKLTSEPSDDHQQPTRSDDRTFGLVRMPDRGLPLGLKARGRPASRRTSSTVDVLALRHPSMGRW
jgi:hypothetical protein